MADLNCSELVSRQRACFLAGRTRPLDWRRGQLTALAAMFKEHHHDFCEALWKDLRRNCTDADVMDVDYIIRETHHALDHLNEWTRPQSVHTSLAMKPGHAEVRRDPLGVTLIISTWNEPFMLLFGPLIPALAAGNTAVLKPSSDAPLCSALAARLVPLYLDAQAVAVVEGGRDVTTALLEQHWDFIFFTGNQRVGRIVHQAAARHLTPCVLELGGKNPTVVHASANIPVAARRIASGRYLNCGQVCTAPDYVLVWPEVKDDLICELRAAIHAFYGDDPQQSPDYGRILDRESFDRVAGLLQSGTAACGGKIDPDERYIAPTVLVDVPPDSPVMQDEIFGPILPVLEIDSVEATIDWLNRRPEPLALYIFAGDDDVAERILGATRSGDAAVNECTVHPLIHELPFGGVGASGMGKYHGRWGFEAFTNARGVQYHSTLIDGQFRYPPYSQNKIARDIAVKLL